MTAKTTTERASFYNAPETKMTTIEHAADLMGEFIEIPAWKTSGLVIGQEATIIGAEGSVRVLVQERADQPVGRCKWYHLEPGQYALA
jgi:hypothetical protein